MSDHRRAGSPAAHGQNGGWQTFALHWNLGCSTRQFHELFGAQVDLDGAEILLETMRLGGSGNRHDPGLLRQQPGQRDLGRRGGLACRESLDQFDQRQIRCTRLGSEARHVVTEVGGIELRVEVDLSRQKARAERAKGHEADAQFIEHGQQLGFRPAVPDRVFALHRRHRMHRMRPADGLHPCLGQAVMPHLAFGDQLAQSACNLLDRHIGIDPVLIEQVDTISLQAPERRLGHHADVLRPTVEPTAAFGGDGIDVEAELGRNHHPISHRGQGLADQFFIDERAVRLCRVEQRHPQIDRLADQGNHVRFVRRRAVEGAHAHAAQSKGRDLQAAAAECACFHDVVLG